MTKFFTFLSLTLLTCFQLAQADVTVTFNVNMSYTIVSDGGVFVAGGGIGNPGDNELTDPDGDGIYSGSIVVADNFFSHYIILNGNCGDYGCKERLVGQSCSDPANFDDRSFQAGTTDMEINTCFGVCSDTTDPPTVDLTFNVNMTNEETSPDGVFFAGGITFGQPGDIPMLDPDNDDIYSVTLTLPVGFRDYHTFTNGNCPGDFNCKEQLGGQACASPEFFNDRLLIVPDADEVIDVCFGFCTEDGSCSVPTAPVTFQVDMTSQTVNPTGVFMGSSIDGWSGNIALDDPDGDGIYSVTLDLNEGVYEYKFINGAGWVDGGEFVPAECDVTGGQFQNRGISVFGTDPVVLDPVCFGACTVECPQLVDVTFQVDMSKQDTNPGGVYMGANFDGWSGNIALMDPDGDDVWEYTATLPAGSYEYKYINGPGWTDGGEFVPDACNVVLGSGFANRGFTIGEDSPASIVMDPVCFAACVDCASFVDVTFRVNMALESVNPAGVFMGSNIDGWSGNIALSQLGVSDIWAVTMNLAPGNYEYKFINGPGWCCAESVPMACDVTVDVPGGPFQNRGVTVTAGVPTMLLPNVCFASCEACPRVGCTDSDSHNYSPRAELDPSQKTFYWDDVAFIDAATNSSYCSTPTTHFAGDAPSEIYLTIENVDASTMEVIIESADADPVDLLLVNGGSGATISDEDFSVAGQVKRTLTWTTPPTDVAMNILWSKASFGGNWQLSQGDIMVSFAASCSAAPTVTGDLPITFDDPAINYDLVDFGGNISAIVTDPTDPNNMVVETTKAPLAQVWAGTTAGGSGLSSPIPFTAASTKMSVRVWSPEAGVNVLLKVEDAANGGIFAESFVNTTVAGEWETMVFDYPNIDVNNTYDKVSIFFDFGTQYPDSFCETCYDGIKNGDEEGIDCGGTNPNCASCDLGCTDMYAHNYNPAASINDGSCETCDDGILNGDEVAIDCGGALCEPCVMGCTDEGAHNYDMLADIDDGSCETCNDGIMNGDELGFDCGGALCGPCMSVSVGTILNIPSSVGTGSINAIVTGGDVSCGTLTYAWTGPGGYTADTEDISDITTAGAYTLTVTDCLGNVATMTVNVVTRTRGRGRKASIISDALFQASPNPFSQQTILSFNLSVEGKVSLDIYDISGRKVAVLFDGTVEAEKDYQFQFGNDLAAGTYVATLTSASGDVKHIKLVVTH